MEMYFSFKSFLSDSFFLKFILVLKNQVEKHYCTFTHDSVSE